MWMFFGIIGFLAALVFFVLALISVIRKKGKGKKYFTYAGIAFVVFILGASLDDTDPEQASVTKDNGQSEVVDSAAVANNDNESTETEDAKKKEDEEANQKAQAEAEAKKKAEEEAKKKAEEAAKAKEEEAAKKPEQTLSQKNAIKKAQAYLNFTAFSKKGLIEQLGFDGFNKEDASYAVNQLNVNWKEQAFKKGQAYLDFTSFSRSGLIEQLEFDGFSKVEATYAVDKIGF